MVFSYWIVFCVCRMWSSSLILFFSMGISNCISPINWMVIYLFLDFPQCQHFLSFKCPYAWVWFQRFFLICQFLSSGTWPCYSFVVSPEVLCGKTPLFLLQKTCLFLLLYKYSLQVLYIIAFHLSVIYWRNDIFMILSNNQLRNLSSSSIVSFK